MQTSLKLLSAALATTMIVALAAPLSAQEKTGPNVDQTAQAGAGGPVSQLAMARSLYAYGVENEDALSVLAAARIARSVTVEEVKRDVKQAAREGGAAETGEGVDAPVDAATMLVTARDLAGDDATLLAMIEDAEVETSKGRIGGASVTLSRLPAGYNDSWEIPYYGGRFAELAVFGDGDANLDVLVTDEYGNTVCVEYSYSDKVYCSWVPAWDGYFYVTVYNMGSVRNSYYIETN